ncbi:MAG: pyridoxal-phosphate dependent enzyme [Xanthobacteraceae bacterium]
MEWGSIINPAAHGRCRRWVTFSTDPTGVACRSISASLRKRTCRSPGASRVIRVSEDEIADAVRLYYTTTHNLAEGAGAAPLAALQQDKARYAGKRAGLILSGGNIDMPVMAQILRGATPAV